MKIDQLTFTRFLAALTVVFFHFGGDIAYLNLHPWNRVLRAGNISVSYFFTLSGFIMAIAYYSLQGDKLQKRRYAIARFARIYPVYLLGLAIIVPTVMYVGDNGKKALALNLTLLQSWFPGYPLTFNTPGWSLSVEAFFYVCLPFLLLLLAKRSSKVLLGIAGVFWVVSQIVHAYLLAHFYQPYPSAEHDFIYYNPIFHLNAFVWGLAIGMLFKRYRDRIQLGPKITSAGVLVSFVLICVSMMYWDRITAPLNTPIALTNGILAPLFGLFIVMLSLDTSVIARLFQNKALLLLGEASYGIYILQEPISQWYFYRFAPRTGWSDVTHFYVFLVLLILISIGVLKLIENPARYWIRRQGQKLFG